MLQLPRFTRSSKILYSLPLGVLVFIGSSFYNHQLQSASLTSVSNTLSNSRLSFRGALTAANSVGSSVITINTTAGAYPSTSSAQLVEGDVVRIGEAGSLGSYTVASTSSNAVFTTTAALAAGDADSADDVISSQSATHTVRFTTVSAISNGRFRILVPALTNDGAAADGIPDGGFFDFGTSAPTVTCPTDVGSGPATYDFVAGTATASTITIGSTDYHSYECAYSGVGAVGTAFDGSSQGAITINGIINPAPKTAHTTGTADTYNIVVQQLSSTLSVIDTTTVAVGVIEAVKLTASVPPQITFQIQGLPTGTSACGISTGVTTTPAAVPFGEISISAFTNAAQAINVSTNAANGFAVTAVENDQMGRNGGVCTGDNTGQDCIRDTIGDGGAISHTTSGEWVTTAAKGLGYSLQDLNSTTTEAFAYNESARTFSAKQFADEENSQTAQTIFSSTGVADNHNVLVCYRIIAAATNAAGNYENFVRYTATATF